MASQVLNGYFLILCLAVLIILVYKICFKRFYSLLRRTRWILATILILYAYAGTGEPLGLQLGAFSPLSTGIIDGLVQIAHLLVILASLSLLLNSLSKAQLLTGLNTLAYPLSMFGLAQERMIVRLALTLHYAENALVETDGSWQEKIKNQLEFKPEMSGFIEIERRSLIYQDWLLIVLSSIGALGAWL